MNGIVFDLRLEGADGDGSGVRRGRRPDGHACDWWVLAPGTHQLMLLECSTDWRREIDARFAIERLDPVAPASIEEKARRFSELPQWIEGMLGTMMELTR